MTVNKQKGEFVAECSDCGAEQAGGVMEDFHAFITELKLSGWRIFKDGDEWIHLCPECKQSRE